MTIIMIKKKTLLGIIIVNDFDSRGKPVRFALLTDDENKYILEPGKKNRDISFIKYNRKKVQINGYIRYDGKRNILTVDEIKIMKDFPKTSAVDIL